MINYLNKKYMFCIIFIGILLLIDVKPGFLQETAESVLNPGEIHFEFNKIVDSMLEPASCYDQVCGSNIQYSYETLMISDRSNEGFFIGVLADSWSLSSDGKKYTFNLKHGITYHDRTPFNAYTMKYSIERMMLINDKSGPAYLLQEYILGGNILLQNDDINITEAKTYLSACGIQAPSDYVLEIVIDSPFIPFLTIIANFALAISPAAVIQHLPSNYTTNQSDNEFGMITLTDLFPNLNDWTKLGLEANHDPAISGIVPQADTSRPSFNSWFLNHMVGTGPWVLESYIANETIIYTKNTDWAGTFASNAVDKIIITQEPETDTIELHFELGQTDWLTNYNNIHDYFNPEGQLIISGINFYTKPKPVTNFLYFDLGENATPFVQPANNIDETWNLTHIQNKQLVRFASNDTFYASLNNPFTSLKFRQAFSNAFDYDSFISQFYYNILGTRAVGVIPRGMVGHQADLIVKKIIPSFDAPKAKQLFQEVGWRGNITFVSTGAVRDYMFMIHKLLKSTIESMNIGITITIATDPNRIGAENNPIKYGGWWADYNDAYNMVFSIFHSTGFISMFLTHYSTLSLDALIDQSKYETNTTNRLNLFREIELLAASDTPFIYLANLNDVFILRDWLHGVEESGSLDPMNGPYRLNFEHISKGTPVVTTSTSTTTPPPGGIPGFEHGIILVLVLAGFARKKEKWI